jgi:hypothetical protein
MDGDEGTDEHYGGRDNDFIDAADSETPGPTDAPDLVDCGSGFDDAQVLPSDIVRDNCENVFAPPDPLGGSSWDHRPRAATAEGGIPVGGG